MLGTIALVVVFGGLMALVIATVAALSSGFRDIQAGFGALSAYQEVQQAIATEAFAEVAYRRAPSEDARAHIRSAIAELDGSVSGLRRLNTAQDDGAADQLLVLNGRYRLSIDTALRDGPRVPGPRGFQVGPALDAMQQLVNAAVKHRQELANHAVAMQKGRFRTLRLLEPAAVVVSMLAVGLCWSVILGQQNQLFDRAEVSEDRSLHDVLTGVGNRALLSQALKVELGGDVRDAALLMVDLDHFKEVNDQYGHAAGDEVLREVARRLQQVSGAPDAVFRMGGDEFTLLVTPAKAADRVVTAIRRALEEPILYEGLELHTQASVGQAVLHPGMDERDLLTAADEALYLTKRATE